MPRDLQPLSVYLPTDVIAAAAQRAQDLSIPVGTLLRMILLGTQPPIVVPSGSRPGETATTLAS